MKRRRFHITYDQAQVIILALTNLITDIDSIEGLDSKAYQITKIYASNLKQELISYKWEE